MWFGMDCGQRTVRVPGQQDLGEGDSCVDFGSIGMTVEVGPSTVMVSFDGCLQLAGSHSLGSGPFHLYLGANCSFSDCPGDFTHEPFVLKNLDDLLQGVLLHGTSSLPTGASSAKGIALLVF